MEPPKKYFSDFLCDDILNNINNDIKESGLPLLTKPSDFQKKYQLPNQFLNLIKKNIKK